MAYVKTQGGQTVYPYSIMQLRKDNPRVSFPKDITDEILSQYGVHFVEVLAPPAYDEVRQRIEQNTTPEQNQEKWVLSWSVVNLTDEEVAQNLAKPEAEVRGMRMRYCQTQTDAGRGCPSRSSGVGSIPSSFA